MGNRRKQHEDTLHEILILEMEVFLIFHEREGKQRKENVLMNWDMEIAASLSWA